ncbi:unnamed protein product [Penicillium glandicola]
MSTAPMTSSAPYLRAYNGQVNLAKAYSWSLTRIQIFMIEVIDKPSTYGVGRHVVSELKRLRTDIVDLSENGGGYQSEPSYPQAISRIVNPAAANEDESYLLLDIMTYGGLPYWNSFDLLAPESATQDNFYLPLTLMYSNWCGKIAPMAPWVSSCVWAEEKGKQSRFHLGASLGGYRNPENRGNRWVKILQRARFNLIRDQRIDTAGITFESTNIKGRGGNAIPFGNCAETYPLVNILRNHDPSEEVYGLALMRRKLPEHAYNHLQALNTLMKPCINCQEVITTWGGKVEKFITDDIPDSSSIASEAQGSATPGPSPGPSGLKVTLPIHTKRPSPADDTTEPAAKRAKKRAPQIPKNGKGKE